MGREAAPLPANTLPYDVRKRKYAPWESRSTQIDGSDSAPHAWNYKMTAQDDDDDDEPDDSREDDAAWGGLPQTSLWWTPAGRSAGGEGRPQLRTQVPGGMIHLGGFLRLVGLSGGSE